MQQVEITHLRININDIALYFDVDGESLAVDGPVMKKKPTLLLLHGGPGFDHSTFKPFFSEFSDLAQVIYLDQRGMGRSDAGDTSSWNLDRWARDVKAFCDALEIEKPIVLGHSFGGFVAIKYGAMFPDHPSKLIISSSLARIDSNTSMNWYRELGGDRAADLYRLVFIERDMSYFDDFLNEVYPLYNTTPQNPDAGKRAVLHKRVAEHFFLGEATDLDLRQDVANIICPTLVLAGDRDPMTPLITADELTRQLRTSVGRYEVVRNAGHGTWKDKPEATATILREFMQPDS